MSTFAHIIDNIVKNIIVADTLENAELATGGAICIEYTNANPVSIGYIYNATSGTFSPPPISIIPPNAQQQNLSALISGMPPKITQAQTDLATISGSIDPLAPILTRTVQGALDLAQGLSDTLSILNVLE